MKKLLFLLTLAIVSVTQSSAEELWGYSLSGEFEFRGGSTPTAPVSDAMFVPGDGELKGAKIVAINLPITCDDYTNIKVWAANALPEWPGTVVNYSHQQAFNQPVKGNSYQRVELNTPWEIPAEGLYVGFTYTTSFSYYLARVAGNIAGSTWDNTFNMWWYEEVGAYHSAIQVFVDKMSIKGSEVDINTVSTRRAEKGAQGMLKVAVSAKSEEAVSSVDYTVTINGKDQTGTVNCNIPAGLKEQAEISLPFTAPATAGNYEVSVALNKINGLANLSTKTGSCKLVVVDKLVPRLTVIEEFTGTGCGNCTRGWFAMEKVKETMSDCAAVIAIHQYNESDPMYCPNYATIEFNGAPSCHIDRRAINLDPYNAENAGIITAVEKYNDIDADAVIELTARYAPGSTSDVEVEATTTFLQNLPGSQIAFVLTADDMSGTTNAWKQSNYLYYEEAAGNGELAIFCPGGIYGESMVFLTYNDVMIGSSWSGTTNTAPAFTTTQMSSKATTKHTVSISLVSRQGLAALKKDKVYMTALVIDGNGKIANAARCHVEGAEPTAVEAIATEKSEQSSVYDLQGRRQVKPAQGLYIQGGRKVLR